AGTLRAAACSTSSATRSRSPSTATCRCRWAATRRAAASSSWSAWRASRSSCSTSPAPRLPDALKPPPPRPSSGPRCPRRCRHLDPWCLLEPQLLFGSAQHREHLPRANEPNHSPVSREDRGKPGHTISLRETVRRLVFLVRQVELEWNESGGDFR